MPLHHTDGTIDLYHEACAKEKMEPECECKPEDHWAEDKFGNEYRVDCGCECKKCREY